MKNLIGMAVATFSIAAAAPAAAAVHVVELTVDPYNWKQVTGEMPYGLTDPPPRLSGEIRIDDSVVTGWRSMSVYWLPDGGPKIFDTHAITDLVLSVGDKTWGLDQLRPSSFAIVSEGRLTFLSLGFEGQSGLSWSWAPERPGSSASLDDGLNYAFCNRCVFHKEWVDDVLISDMGYGVPEPSTWAMMILGFGLAGSSLRSARSQRPGQLHLPRPLAVDE